MSKKKRESKQLNLEDRYEEVRQLLSLGKDRGYLAIEEINEALPEDLTTSPEEIEEVFSLFETLGIELVDAETKERLTRPDGPAPKSKEHAKQEPPDSLLEKTNDPVRMYLREMGTVPLLTREGEVSIARRIERGERRVKNSLARSAFAISELRRLADMIRKGLVSPNLFADNGSNEDNGPEKRLVQFPIIKHKCPIAACK